MCFDLFSFLGIPWRRSRRERRKHVISSSAARSAARFLLVALLRFRAVPARRAVSVSLSAALASQSRACCTDLIRPLGLQGLKKTQGLRKNMTSRYLRGTQLSIGLKVLRGVGAFARDGYVRAEVQWEEG